MKKLIIALILLAAAVHIEPAQGQDDPIIRIYGEVDTPMNLTLADLEALPLVDVNASCICVGVPPENLGANSFVVYTYTWTGVRVSDLLDLTGVQSSAVDVVFRDMTSYSSSLPMDVAERDEVILALYADGERLTKNQGYPYRLVVPCWWGYKWVKYISRIEVVDYDHTGYWENHEYPDIAEIPGCTYVAENPAVFTVNSWTIGLIGAGLVLLAVFSALSKGQGDSTPDLNSPSLT